MLLVPRGFNTISYRKSLREQGIVPLNDLEVSAYAHELSTLMNGHGMYTWDYPDNLHPANAWLVLDALRALLGEHGVYMVYVPATDGARIYTSSRRFSLP